MSARASAAVVQIRIEQALREEIARLGTTKVAAELGLNDSTVRRRLSGELRFTLEDFVGVICHQRDDSGGFTILDALCQAVRGGDSPRGDAAVVHSSVLRWMAGGSTGIAQAAEALRDGALTPREAAQLRDWVIEQRTHEPALLAALEALIATAQTNREPA